MAKACSVPRQQSARALSMVIKVNADAPATRRTQRRVRIYIFPGLEWPTFQWGPPLAFGCLTARNEPHLAGNQSPTKVLVSPSIVKLTDW